MATESKLTSKGQVTIPVEVRLRLGAETGDRLVFEFEGTVARIRVVKRERRFARYRGIGVPGMGKGKQAVVDLVRSMRDE
jgi:AbrB family looped-hinge helix DNA binding protein